MVTSSIEVIPKGILNMLRQGVHGDIKTIQSWCKMLRQLSQDELPENLSQFENEFKDVKRNGSLDCDSKLDGIDVAKLEKIANSLVSQGKLELKPPYREFRLKDKSQWIFQNKNSDIIFAGNILTHEPLQFIRSRTQNFCEAQNINKTQADEIVIAVTEAAENAVKYSDQFPFVIKHGFTDDTYMVEVYNSYSEVDLDDEIKRGKFSERVSLMRGILVMSKLLDSVEIEKISDSHLVAFVGTKKITR